MLQIVCSRSFRFCRLLLLPFTTIIILCRKHFNHNHRAVQRARRTPRPRRPAGERGRSERPVCSRKVAAAEGFARTSERLCPPPTFRGSCWRCSWTAVNVARPRPVQRTHPPHAGCWCWRWCWCWCSCVLPTLRRWRWGGRWGVVMNILCSPSRCPHGCCCCIDCRGWWPGCAPSLLRRRLNWT